MQPLVGLTSVACFMIFYPTSFAVDEMNVISTQYLGAQRFIRCDDCRLLGWRILTEIIQSQEITN